MTDANGPSWIVRIPTPIWLVGLIGAALLIDRPLQYPAIVQHRPGGIVLIVLGVLFSVWGQQTFRRHRAEIMPSSAVHSILVANGPYRFTRNPMYLGAVVVGVGTALVAGTWLMWLVPAILFALQNFVIIPFEERSMEAAFGETYRAYRARVRRWI